jgi:hypothetical protein
MALRARIIAADHMMASAINLINSSLDDSKEKFTSVATLFVRA